MKMSARIGLLVTDVKGEDTSWKGFKFATRFCLILIIGLGTSGSLGSSQCDPDPNLETPRQECVMNSSILNSDSILQARDEIQKCSAIPVTCGPPPRGTEYRRIDGSCNNLKNPSWGMANICLRRILPHVYADGISKPRISCTGQSLPNPRVISNKMHQELRVENEQLTTLFLEWGQIFAHDLSLNDFFKTKESNFNFPINCCDNGPKIDDQCFSIQVPENDSFYPKHGVNCLGLIRTLTCKQCSGKRQQSNRVTSYHDLSLIYGSNDEQARKLRTRKWGTLRVQHGVRGCKLLPGVDVEELCESPNSTTQCFTSGDTRGNQNLLLITLITIFVRYHNYLCKELQFLNPLWGDERIYQEARRIFIAQAQVISFKHYLPQVLGEYMNKYDLTIREGERTKYDPNLDASVIDEFSTVASRYGHTLIPNEISSINPWTGVKSGMRFRDFYFNPFSLHNGQLDNMALGMSRDLVRKHDLALADDVRNWVYTRNYKNESPTLDLAALSIVRGRDHAIPGYTYYLSHFFNITVTTFEDLKRLGLLPSATVDQLSEIYASVHDVEIYVAGLAEPHVKGGIVGATFARLLVEQFKRVKFGDRFWFQHANQAGSFSYDQLREISKVTLSEIICVTTNIIMIQTDVFLPPSDSNPMMFCNRIRKFNSKYWKDKWPL